MDFEKVKRAVDQEYPEICENCFSKWSISLWNWSRYDSFTFEENKAAFFYLIERLLREGKVKFGDPDDWSWKATPEDMIAHLKKGWPKDVMEEGDMKIVDYFYDLDRCPPISWLGEDGEWHGS